MSNYGDGVVLRGDELIEFLDNQLANYAVKHKYGKEARLYPEKYDPNDNRNPFQHDRDRIIHSRAFRRLKGKTQVFTVSRNDHIRTRLSHTLEVAQLSRSVARALRLNEDLAEAIALGHDLGHPPFGHAAEEELNDILRGRTKLWTCDIGGFKHNINSLKIVDYFERAYAEFPGLNLTHWTREGILKHTGLNDKKDGLQVHDPTIDMSKLRLEVGVPSFLEGQIVAVCDELAQVTHDLEDAGRAGIVRDFSEEASPWCEIEIFSKALERARQERFYDETNLRSRLIRHLINLLMEDLISATEERIKKCILECGEVDPVKQPFSTKIVDFSADVAKQVENLQKLLRETVYASYEVSRGDIKARLYIQSIFKAYYDHPSRMPDYVYRKYNDAKGASESEELKRSNLEKFKDKIKNDPIFVRTIVEHIAGMTDQYLLNEYRQLFTPEIW
ncbi:dGTP triphosphohydrolase [Thermosediminibacter oceani]|uniref:Deoxyguanosinetriphosphate triphosphohydrolase-like protein n=1 Tax=Thermosediminibacter oceani (strain ATCC BAA-1034 / DSM 16646 / JW/IW-1228P) TaxID=555079 RepID=D9S1L1_THEOJ|nr:dNTP triphosphohydrolase [Thermosediminibacter oceani]ADL07288.1 deoxyguanosinetriphosphate triphosphohydrolase [Thermosediminibacter oceani DSM 16646]